MTREEKREYYKKWYQANREKKLEYQELYSQAPMGRASNLLKTYNQSDKKYNRGQGNLSAEWIVDNIFSKPCAHCGKEGWKLIGCNRIDSSKPHTMDNVEPCCLECNWKLAAEDKKTDFAKHVYQYTLDGKLVRVWASTMECGRNGFDQSAVSKCCRKCYNKEGNDIYKGYRWSYAPL